jgi:hypothetical protein
MSSPPEPSTRSFDSAYDPFTAEIRTALRRAVTWGVIEQAEKKDGKIRATLTIRMGEDPVELKSVLTELKPL